MNLLILAVMLACTSETAAPADAAAAQQPLASSPATALPMPSTWVPSEEITGSLEPRAAVQLGFDVPGRLATVGVTRGQSVKKGEVLGALDAAMARAQLQQATAAQASAVAQLAAAEAGWTRTQALKEAGGLSDQQMADAEAGILAMRAATQQADAAVQLARTHLAHHKLEAPFDGVVTNAPDNAGAMVGAGTPLFVVEDLSALQIKGTVPETTTWVQPGQRAVVTAGSATADATVVRVLPSLDPATRRVPVEVMLEDPPAAFRAHAFVRVRLEASEPQDVMAVPASAVVARPDFSVFAVEGKNPKRVPVEVLGDAPDSHGSVLVRGALSAEVPVLVHPPINL